MPIPAFIRANIGRPAQLADSILQPESLKVCEESLKPEAIRRMWPREVAEKSFIDNLRSQYDYTQLGAIEVRPSQCKCHADEHAAPLKRLCSQEPQENALPDIGTQSRGADDAYSSRCDLWGWLHAEECSIFPLQDGWGAILISNNSNHCLQAAACHLGAPALPSAPAGLETLPFLLVQGTGKMHTVKGIPFMLLQ